MSNIIRIRMQERRREVGKNTTHYDICGKKCSGGGGGGSLGRPEEWVRAVGTTGKGIGKRKQRETDEKKKKKRKN